MSFTWQEFLIAGSIGLSIGFAELVTRYRDKPFVLIKRPPALAYILINGLASAGGLWMVDIFEWTGPFDTTASRAKAILLAGFGAMAFFRTSLFTTRVGDSDVDLGPSQFLKSILGAVDREVNRIQAIERATLVRDIEDSLVYSDVQTSLVAFCFGLIQTADPLDQSSLAQEVDRITKENIADTDKRRLLLVQLINYFGPDVVKSAVKFWDG